MHAREFACDQRRTLQFADAYRQVDVFLDQIDVAVVQVDIHVNVGIAGEKIADRPRQLTDAEAKRQREPDAARYRRLPARDRLLGIAQIRQQLHRALVEFAAGLGQRLPARRALQQLHAETALELAHPATHHRLGDTKFFGSVAEALEIDDGDICFELVEATLIVH